MRLSLKARRILEDLRLNLSEQDKLNSLVIRMRHLDKPRLAQVAIEKLTDVVSEQGVLVSQLKREGFDENTLRGMILEV